MSRRMHGVVVLLSMLLVVGFTVFGQNAKTPPQNLHFVADYSQFRYSDSLMYVEFSASVDREMLVYIADGGRFKGEFLVTAELLQQDSVVSRKMWRNVNQVDSLAEIVPGQKLYCMNSFVVSPQPSRIRLTIQDPQYPQGAGVVEWPFQPRLFSGDSLQLSDIQMAGSIERDTTTSVYTKNGFRISPNPTALYGIGLPIMYSYLEIYNLAPASSEAGGNYRVEYKVYSTDGVLVKSYGVKERRKPGTSAVEVNGANVVTLVSGAYLLRVEVTDLETNAIAKAEHKFFVYREGDYAEGGERFKKREEILGAGSAGLDAGRYDTMSEKELNTEFEYARYIASKEERDTYKRLNLEGKRKYIKEFWAKRDQTPNTPENEYKRDYLERVQHANQSLRGTFRDGWRTDRGRVILIYGRADEIERFPFNNQNRSYEIWHYYQVQGGVVFIFVDKREMGDYELVHSTARGELYDEEWPRWINPNSDASSSGVAY
ncbi:MAG TPA: GWxTD domain-containing protein [bacterium]|nr:GWxTD domain-containing protein [bacterium]HPN33743.1 GWxTD domain-containing protein [bacterium]